MSAHDHKIEDPPTLHDVDNPAKVFMVYLVVLGLALANIFLARAGLGPISLPVQMGIATVQAVLVAWYWMHLRRKDTIITLTAVTSLFFVFIFYVLVLSDVLTRTGGGL
ncbi:MAG: cytochrome C oxidase subunit IV family protein [Gemmataceae bacterium]